MGAQKIKKMDGKDAGKGGKTQKAPASTGKKKLTREAIEERKKQQMEKRAKGRDVRYIVRIVNKDLDGTLPLHRSLTSLKGINNRFAVAVSKAFEKKSGFGKDKLLGEVPEEKWKDIEDVINNPLENGIPSWMVNTEKGFEDGQNKHLVMADLDFAQRTVSQREGEIKSYRGLRYVWRLPVRGQRTKSTHRGKGKVVGVLRKDNKK